MCVLNEMTMSAVLSKSIRVVICGVWIFVGWIFFDGYALAGPPEPEVVGAILTKGIAQLEDGIQTPMEPVDQFANKDEAVISYISYINLFGNHAFRWKWIDPQGNIYMDTKSFAVSAPYGKIIRDGSIWHKIRIRDERAMTLTGEWKVEVFMDDQLVSAQDFSIHPPRVPDRPPELAISRISLSKNILLANDTVNLNVTIENTGAGDAENVALMITCDNLEISYEKRKRFEKIPKKGGKVSVSIPLRGNPNLNDGNAAIDIEVVEPHFGVEAETKRVMIATMHELPQ